METLGKRSTVSSSHYQSVRGVKRTTLVMATISTETDGQVGYQEQTQMRKIFRGKQTRIEV